MTIGIKIAEGREAEVYAWEDGAVLKLYRAGYLGHVAESSALARLQGDGVAPRLIGTAELDGRHGLILERLDGSDMMTLLERAPWRLLGLARAFAETHVLVNSVQAAPDLPDLKQTLAARIHAGVTRPQLRDFVLRVLDQLPAGDRLCHGDLHPGNVLVASGRARVIDWPSATRGVPEADYARTLWLLTRGDPLPGTSPLLRGLMATGRQAYARAYARIYRQRARASFSQVPSWTLAHAAARLAEGIDAERAPILAFLGREMQKATRR